jgi:hypothetical protein
MQQLLVLVLFIQSSSTGSFTAAQLPSQKLCCSDEMLLMVQYCPTKITWAENGINTGTVDWYLLFKDVVVGTIF